MKTMKTQQINPQCNGMNAGLCTCLSLSQYRHLRHTSTDTAHTHHHYCDGAGAGLCHMPFTACVTPGPAALIFMSPRKEMAENPSMPTRAGPGREGRLRVHTQLHSCMPTCAGPGRKGR